MIWGLSERTPGKAECLNLRLIFAVLFFFSIFLSPSVAVPAIGIDRARPARVKFCYYTPLLLQDFCNPEKLPPAKIFFFFNGRFYSPLLFSCPFHSRFFKIVFQLPLI